ncbi:hypothetical protein TWF481_008810 [Arthrobotrys musiformis]|uniref:BTB domain-containing protein n=1 Tax=Arthrobotrys musiformis TaxID=47236 RepID=A0AAV9WA14_9PEZI
MDTVGEMVGLTRTQVETLVTIARGLKEDDPYYKRQEIKNLYYESGISDFSVYIGRKKFRFRLHEAALASCSDYFKAASEKRWQQTPTRGIWFKHIDVGVFEVIALWIYGHGYRLPVNPFSRYFIKQTYIAADYLLIPSLKVRILNVVQEFWRHDIIINSIGRRMDPDPYNLYRTLCTFSQTSQHNELKGLRDCATLIIQGFGSHRVGPPRFAHNDESAGVPKMFELLSEAYHIMIMDAICCGCFAKLDVDIKVREKCSCLKCHSAQDLLAQPAEKNPFNLICDFMALRGGNGSGA